MYNAIPGSMSTVPATIDKTTLTKLFAEGPRSGTVFFDDFECGGGDTTGAASVPANVNFSLGWRAGVSGAGATCGPTTTGLDATHFGIIDLTTGTTTTGVGSMVKAPVSQISTRVIGAGQSFIHEWLVRIPNLSTVGEEYIARFGIADSTAPSNGTYFEYDRLTSTNWRGVTRAAGVSTAASGGTNVAVAAGAWLRLTLTWDGATASFYVDGVLIGTSTTNIPTLGIAVLAHITKSAGTTSRDVLVDYFWERLLWTPSRAA